MTILMRYGHYPGNICFSRQLFSLQKKQTVSIQLFAKTSDSAKKHFMPSHMAEMY